MKELLHEKGLWTASVICAAAMMVGFPFYQVKPPLETGSFLKFLQEALEAQILLFDSSGGSASSGRLLCAGIFHRIFKTVYLKNEPDGICQKENIANLCWWIPSVFLCWRGAFAVLFSFFVSGGVPRYHNMADVLETGVSTLAYLSDRGDYGRSFWNFCSGI